MNDITGQLASHIVSGRLPCSRAFRVADALGIEPSEVGDEADRAGVRISRCQLGLFGYEEFGDKQFNGRVSTIPPELQDALAARAGSDTIACADVWRAADDCGSPRLLAGLAAGKLGLRVRSCQLGCFG